MKASKEPRNQREISLSQIVLPDEEQANRVLEELRNGVSFDEIARKKSIHKESAEKGGLLGWTLPSQLLAPLGDVSINLDKGRTNQLPVKTSFGWHIIRVNDTRPFVLPAFDQLKGQIQESLIFKQRNQALATLLAKYKVTKR
jgi:peptidyl-prolyl cis-trans isomerase C